MTESVWGYSPVLRHFKNDFKKNYCTQQELEQNTRAQLQFTTKLSHIVYDLTSMITAALQLCACRKKYWVIQFLYQAARTLSQTWY